MSGLTRSRGERGLTLIELMVAVVMIAVAMLLAGRVIVQVVQQVGVSESQAQASEFAVEELERIKLLDFDSIQASGPDPLPYAPAYSRTVEVRDVGGGATDVYDYRIVTVTVEPPGELRPVSLSTAVAGK